MYNSPITHKAESAAHERHCRRRHEELSYDDGSHESSIDIGLNIAMSRLKRVCLDDRKSPPKQTSILLSKFTM